MRCQVLEREPPPLGTDAEIPAELQRIVGKMLRKDREERYQTIKDLLLDLKIQIFPENTLSRALFVSGTYEPEIVPSPPRHLFSRGGPTGRVDLTRSGNTVQATTRGVAAFTLLLSPDRFDFRKPVKVVANGRTLFDGKVDKNLRTLLKYAAADNDRTMLFGAELHIDLTR